MGRPKKPEAVKFKSISISLPPGVVDDLRELAKDDRGRELAGGLSGAVRGIVEPHLARRRKREVSA